MQHYIRLPRKFINDRLERDLDCGETTTYGNQVLCICSTEVLKDIADDADYQARETDADLPSLKRSAARAHAKVIAYMAEQGIA